MKHHISRHHLNQTGIVSIMVSVVLMAVMSLIVLGFAEIARHDQRQALDRQLSSQAFYAAETGINDAQAVIEADLNHTPPIIPPDKTSCLPDSGAGPAGRYTVNNVVDASHGVSYSCLLVNTNPTSLVKRLSANTSSWVVPIEPDDVNGNPVTVHKITLSWQDVDPTVTSPQSKCPSAGSKVLPQAYSWNGCGYGLLRVDLVPVPAAGPAAVSRVNLLKNDFVGYFMPSNSSGSGTVSFNGAGNLYGGSASQGSITSADCDGTQCQMTVSVPTSPSYYLRILDLYADSNVTIYACDSGSVCNSTNSVHLAKAQALVDSTGKAQDVLRRIQVRIPMSSHGGQFSDYALATTNSICKEFSTYPTDPATATDGFNPGPDNGNCSYY